MALKATSSNIATTWSKM